MASKAFSVHDHGLCATMALRLADERARTQGLRLTPTRRRVLEILLEEHRALGAYDVLERLSAEGLGHQPPVAYRALEFLVDNGFAHRINRLNAFAACSHPDRDHAPLFLICRDCRALAEAPEEEVRGAIDAAAAKHGFSVERVITEVLGLCPRCASEAVS